MRIIAGEFRGRTLKPPSDKRTRPTADRVREAWFSILAGEIPGATVLDLFAGSGALGLEALSRGASHVEFVEISRASLTALRANVAALDAEARVTIHKADALRFVERLPVGAFGVALADPPYDTAQALEIVEAFRLRPFATLLGVEHRSSTQLPGDETRRYGDTALTFCRAP
ncbi:MAG: 16S rRNA (guanine(966)-N(2))-methyltransferase RsmD [Gemmatimonadetes bacterium]|nr:16S rRNA (guanine(966)-N(2))-methyltransferase RsmD [Gemmatimonadota bacterium]